VKLLIQLGLLACAAAPAVAHPVSDRQLSVTEKAARLKSGQFVWEPKAAPTGPAYLVIDLSAQRVLLFRNGVLMAASTISSGSKGRETPTGLFTILQKEVVHRSRTYDDAPMPYMQRLTWKGVAMHAGQLPGYPASHGCVRLPKGFAKLLYGLTVLGTPVMITDEAELAEQARRAAEYQLATEEFAREKADQNAAAERALAEFDRAKAAHEQTLRKHNAEMAKYKPDFASK
jgi:L,D-transpeptidase catalytic domain